MSHKADDAYDENGRVKINIFDNASWTRHMLNQMRDFLTLLALVWLVFCTMFVFMVSE